MTTIILVATCLTVLAQEHPKPPDKAEPTKENTTAPSEADQAPIIKLEFEYALAMEKNDLEKLDSFFADEYVATNADGNVTANKAKVMSDLESQDTRYDSYAVDDLNVRVYGDTATVTGHARTTGVSKGQRFVTERRYTRTWVKRDDKWRIVSFQVTAAKSATDAVIIGAVSLSPIRGLVTVEVLLFIKGVNFGGSGARVLINGTDVSKQITAQQNYIIEMKGSKGSLNLNSKSENRVVVIANGKESNSYLFTQKF
jgi:ketosteroid isomerase-like protein